MSQVSLTDQLLYHLSAQVPKLKKVVCQFTGLQQKQVCTYEEV